MKLTIHATRFTCSEPDEVVAFELPEGDVPSQGHPVDLCLLCGLHSQKSIPVPGTNYGVSTSDRVLLANIDQHTGNGRFSRRQAHTKHPGTVDSNKPALAPLNPWYIILVNDDNTYQPVGEEAVGRGDEDIVAAGSQDTRD